MHIETVIGSNYGDEGKGLFTEYLCRNRCNPLVVLSNGGCQRGHTVNNVEKNIRHVFHHFGSGTLLGKPSVYAKTFLLNPIKYVEEKHELGDVGIIPIAFRAPSCLLQLPSDMYVNQVLERSRKDKKHGSCGWGIWETILRNQEHAKITFESFKHMSHEMKRKCILDELDWQIENRIHAEGYKLEADLFIDLVNYHFIEHFIRDFEEMTKSCILLENDNLLENDYEKYGYDVDTLVVENAQGLLLDKTYAPEDENGKTDVHSTPSKTGLEGAIEAIGDDSNLEGLSVNYISRSYFTRHGAGPFPQFTESLKYIDKTNMPNEYQGDLRFGKMKKDDVEVLYKRIHEDAYSTSKIPDKINIVATHMNEYENEELKTKSTFVSYKDDSTAIREIDE